MRGKTKMTVARDLADFLVGTATSDLPPQAMQHAAMVIASTIDTTPTMPVMVTYQR